MNIPAQFDQFIIRRIGQEIIVEWTFLQLIYLCAAVWVCDAELAWVAYVSVAPALSVTANWKYNLKKPVRIRVTTVMQNLLANSFGFHLDGNTYLVL